MKPFTGAWWSEFMNANPWTSVEEMPKDYTCVCGKYVHPSRWKATALHATDCPFHRLERDDNEEVWKE